MVKSSGNGLGMIVAMGTVVAILIGGYTASPSYAKVTKFESTFESSSIPLWGTKEIVFSGI